MPAFVDYHYRMMIIVCIMLWRKITRC